MADTCLFVNMPVTSIKTIRAVIRLLSLLSIKILLPHPSSKTQIDIFSSNAEIFKEKKICPYFYTKKGINIINNKNIQLVFNNITKNKSYYGQMTTVNPLLVTINRKNTNS